MATNTKGSIVERANGKFAVVLYIDGKHRWRTYPDKASAELALAESRVARMTGTYIAPKHETMAVFMRGWLASIEGSVKASTHDNYRTLVEGHVVGSAIGRIKVSALTARDLSAYYAKLSTSGRKSGKGGLSSRTVRLIHTVISKALSDAVRQGELSRNVALMATLPRATATGSAMHFWTGEQVKSFLDHARSDRYYAAYVLAVTSGMRRGEIAGLSWQQVDLDRATLSVTQSLTLVRYKPVLSEPKTKSSRRRVSLDAFTVEALREYRKRQLAERIMLGLGKERPDALVFTDELGQAINPEALAERFVRLSKAAGLPPIRFHDLRHTSASLALRAGVNPKVVQERLGHSNVSLTLSVYSHVSQGMDAAAADSIASSIFG